MKQVIAYVLIALTLLSHAGRTERDAKEEQSAPETEVTEAAAAETEETVAVPIAGAGNPFTYYDSLSELNIALGCHLGHPRYMEITNESFCTISIPGSTIAQYKFTVNGIEFMYRFSTDFDHDISGTYSNGNTIFAYVEGDAKIEFEGGKAARVLTDYGQYVLVAKDNGVYDMEQFSSVADDILASITPDLSAIEFAGDWCDITSDLTTMHSEAVDGVLYVEVYSLNSQYGLLYWSFSGTAIDEGFVSYSNGIKKAFQYDEYGELTPVILAENEEGYLLINTDGNIEWTYPTGDGETATTVFAYDDSAYIWVSDESANTAVS